MRKARQCKTHTYTYTYYSGLKSRHLTEPPPPPPLSSPSQNTFGVNWVKSPKAADWWGQVWTQRQNFCSGAEFWLPILMEPLWWGGTVSWDPLAPQSKYGPQSPWKCSTEGMCQIRGHHRPPPPPPPIDRAWGSSTDSRPAGLWRGSHPQHPPSPSPTKTEHNY